MERSSYHPYDFRLRRDAAVLEPGSLNLLGIQALGAAVDLLLEAGAEQVEERVVALAGAFEDGVRAGGRRLIGQRAASAGDGVRVRSGIVTFEPRGVAERVRQELWARDVVTKVRFGGLRVAPHHYQDEGDVARFLERLEQAEAAAA